MASKKKGQLAKYCRIFQWVEDQDADFAGAIRDLCLEGLLSPGSGGRGVTLLYPNKACREEIVSKEYSDDAEAAVKLVEAHILPDVFSKSADFSSHPVGNRLGFLLDKPAVSGGTVKFEGGLTIKIADSFHPLGGRDGRDRQIAVWLVESGRGPLTGAAYRPAPAAKRGGAVGGGRRRAIGGGPTPRQQLAAAAESDFDQCMALDRCRTRNPYLAAVVSLLRFLQAKAPDAFLAVLPILDYDPVISFYLLLEPYKAQGDLLLAEGLLFGDGAWNGTIAYGDAVADYESIIRSAAGRTDAVATDRQGAPCVPMVFRDRARVAAAVDKVRMAITALSPRQGADAVKQHYATLAGENRILDVSPVLPDATNAALAGERKLWQDEFRFFVHAALEPLRQQYVSADFAALVHDLREVRPGNSYAKEISLLNTEDLKSSVAPNADMMLIKQFVKSTDFLYTPPAPEAVGGAWGGGVGSDPREDAVFNRNHDAHQCLRRTKGMAHSAGITAATLNELELYVAAHGHLPEAVAALGRGRS